MLQAMKLRQCFWGGSEKLWIQSCTKVTVGVRDSSSEWLDMMVWYFFNVCWHHQWLQAYRSRFLAVGDRNRAEIGIWMSIDDWHDCIIVGRSIYGCFTVFRRNKFLLYVEFLNIFMFHPVYNNSCCPAPPFFKLSLQVWKSL